MKKNLITSLVVALFFTTGLHAQLITMTAESTKQGKFKGESNKSKFADKIELSGFIQEVNSPREAGTGIASGKRSYQPIILLKQAGVSSPQFFQAIATGEILKKVVIEFYKTEPGTGTEINYYRITLENVMVSGFKQFIGPLQNEKFNPADNTLFDEIRLVFQKITIEENIGKTIAVDEANQR
jgi:type VI secretion system secreted protein Hcp